MNTGKLTDRKPTPPRRYRIKATTHSLTKKALAPRAGSLPASPSELCQGVGVAACVSLICGPAVEPPMPRQLKGLGATEDPQAGGMPSCWPRALVLVEMCLLRN